MAQVCTHCGSMHRVSRFRGGDPLCLKHYLQMYQHGYISDQAKSRLTNQVFVNEDGCTIITAKGERILVDLDMLPRLNMHSWCISKTGYAVANISKKVVKMHRLITGCGHEYVVDHVNGNKLDNRRCNLRICSARNNSRNKGIGVNNSSGVIGVSKLPNGKWRARIMVDRKEVALGHFERLEEAVAARKQAEMNYFGQYSRSASLVTSHE